MSVYAKSLEHLVLFEEIASSVGRDDIDSAEVKQLQSMLMSVAEEVGPLLARIPVTFKQYTEHGMLHAVNLIKLMGAFIPEETRKGMNGLELTLLILAAMLHDFGMYATQEERDRYVNSDAFRDFIGASTEKQHAIERARAENRPAAERAIEDAALAEYFRKRHPERVRENIDRHLPGHLRFRDQQIAALVKDICESHGWGVHESSDPAAPDKTVTRGLKAKQVIYRVPFSPQYTAVCLRLADIMDFDPSRTPLSLLQTITDAKSYEEWQKHLSIRGFEVTERTAEFFAECSHPAHYVAVNDFLDWIDVELTDCRRLVMRESGELAASEKYRLHLPSSVDRFHVGMEDKSFIAGAFRFELDYERIMKLLMDKSLYPDPSLFLRELLQNSLDACRLRLALMKEKGAEALYKPRIQVFDHSKDPDDPRVEFLDNGIGMSEEVVKNYFMRVGRSYYRSNEFDATRARLGKQGIELEATSQFGIGVLSCFMVGDRIDIETYRFGSTPLRVEIEGPTKYFLIRKQSVPSNELGGIALNAGSDTPPGYPGTRIIVHLTPGVELDVYQVLARFAVNVDFAIFVHEGKATREIKAWRWRDLDLAPGGAPDFFQFEVAETSCGQQFNDAVIAVPVPLEEYDFCSHLSGKAWFWLLREEDGRPTPTRGHLMVGSNISCTGSPSDMSHSSSSFGRALPWLREHVDVERIKSDNTSLIPPLIENWWNAADRFQRLAIIEWFSNKGDKQWFQSSEVVADLLIGNDWTRHLVNYSSTVSVTGSSRLAIHGIELPAAITVWDPMEGFATRPDLLEVIGGYLVDCRYNSPVPAANRLFLDENEGEKVAVPLLRAFIRTAVELAATGHLGWQRWLTLVFEAAEDFRFSALAVRAEKDLIRRRVLYEVIEAKGDSYFLDEAQLRTRLGNPLPFGYPWDARAGATILVFNSRNAALVLDRHVYLDSMRRLVVDLDSDAKRSARSLGDVFSV